MVIAPTHGEIGLGVAESVESWIRGNWIVRLSAHKHAIMPEFTFAATLWHTARANTYGLMLIPLRSAQFLVVPSNRAVVKHSRSHHSGGL